MVQPITSLFPSKFFILFPLTLLFFFEGPFCTFRYLLEGRFSLRVPRSMRFWTWSESTVKDYPTRFDMLLRLFRRLVWSSRITLKSCMKACVYSMRSSLSSGLSLALIAIELRAWEATLLAGAMTIRSSSSAGLSMLWSMVTRLWL